MSVDPIVLRYRNNVYDTIKEHIALLDASGSVWWGWWRKEGIEPDRREVLQRLSALRKPFEIGLIDRDAEVYSMAVCTAVIFRDDGERLSCPSPEGCPSYYRSADCAAWFSLTKIVILDKTGYIARFGPVPAGNSTLYEVKKRGSSVEVLPKPGWNLQPVHTPGELILHVSDLHFGTSHGYAIAKPQPGRGVASPTLDEILVEQLSDQDIGVVVVSGDCVTKGEAGAFAPLETFLERLSVGLSLQRDHFVIVPGNHDFGVLPNDGTIPAVDYSYERDFRRFAENFYGQRSIELERLQRFTTPSGWDLIFMALNSARLRGIDIKEYGYVGRHRYEGMLSYLGKTLKSAPSLADKRLVTAVLHHHVMAVSNNEFLPPAGKVSMTVDAGDLMTALQRSRVQLVLHGHQHLPFIFGGGVRSYDDGDRLRLPPPQAAVSVVGMGSTGAGVSELADGLPENTYGVYRPSTDGLQVLIKAFNRVRAPRTYFDEILRLA